MILSHSLPLRGECFVHWSYSFFFITDSHHSKSPDGSKRKVKQNTKWDNGGSSKDMGTLDFSGTSDDSAFIPTQAEVCMSNTPIRVI